MAPAGTGACAVTPWLPLPPPDEPPPAKPRLPRENIDPRPGAARCGTRSSCASSPSTARCTSSASALVAVIILLFSARREDLRDGALKVIADLGGGHGGRPPCHHHHGLAVRDRQALLAAQL